MKIQRTYINIELNVEKVSNIVQSILSPFIHLVQLLYSVRHAYLKMEHTNESKI